MQEGKMIMAGRPSAKGDGFRYVSEDACPVSAGVVLSPKWYTVAQVAELLGYGESKVRMLIISGDLRSLKDGRSRRVLPEWVDAYVQLRASQVEGC